jgi:hypothetical protein
MGALSVLFRPGRQGRHPIVNVITYKVGYAHSHCPLYKGYVHDWLKVDRQGDDRQVR